MKKIADYPLISHNTFGIQAKTELFIEYDNEPELIEVLPEIQGMQVLHIGSGSNLLFTSDFKGVILHSNIKGITLTARDDDHVMLRVGAAVVWDELVDYAVGQGWSGIENLSLIPGETGAAAVQNIGAYGSEAKDVIMSVETIDLHDGTKRIFSNAECGYAYRQSVFKHDLKGRYAVTFVNFRLSRQFNPNTAYGNIRQALEGLPLSAATVRQAIIDIRNAKLPDPKVMGNAGSFFMNPVVTNEKFEELKAVYPEIPSYQVEGGVKIPAGWLIEQAGWKGRSLGKAAVHDKQALVIVNRGGATAAEIQQLSDTIQKAVLDRFGVAIKPEVNFI